MANDKTIIRTRKNRENPYVMLNKTSLQDSRLSWKAKGLHAYLMSLPDDWTIYIQELINHAKDGRDATRAAFKELELAGYITNEAIRNEKGRIEKWEKIVYEQPLHWDEFEMPKGKKKKSSRPQTENPYLDEKPETDFPDLENPHLENPTLLNNDLTNNDLSNKLTNNNEKDPRSLSTLISNDRDSVVVAPDHLESFLAKKKLRVNKATITKWTKLADEETIISAIEYTLAKGGVKTVTGYVTRILGAGFTPDLATPATQTKKQVKKDNIPEWIAHQEAAATTEELSPEQKKQAEELLRALGEID